MSIPEEADQRKAKRGNDVGGVIPLGRRGRLRIWGGEGNRNAQITFRQLLDLLGYQQDEFVSVCHKIGSDGKFMTAVVEPQEAATVVESLPPEADVWFGVNPTCGPVGRVGRGTAAQVTRHAALYADLDVEPGKCPTFDVAHAIVDDLSAILGERPSVVVKSGHGLHPYWPIDRESAATLSNGDAEALFDRFGRLVKTAAGQRDCKVDNVFEPARVLRVPGTTNNKNGQSGMPVIAHPDTGGALTVEQIRNRLEEFGIGKLEQVVFNAAANSAAPETFSRSCLVNRVAKAQIGKRNNTLFGAAKDAARQGDLDDDMIAELIDAAVSTSTPGDPFTETEAISTIRSAARYAPANDGDAPDGEPVTRSLADATPTKVRWLWHGWLPRGKVTILEGEPEEGKSVITLDWTAIVTQGREWPLTIVGDEPLPRDKSEPAGVVLVGVEDDEEDTVVPRLDAAGANRHLVYAMNQPKDKRGNPKPFVIPEGVDRLRCAINEVKAKVVIIDPITAFLSTKQARSGDDPSTRQALMPLVTLAAETGCAIVLVRHLNKTQGMSAKNRGSGTIAYTGIARSVIVAGELKEPKQNGPTHAIALTKGNLTKRPKAIGYRLDSAPSDLDNPVVTWLGPLDLTADQLVGADGAKVSDARKSAPVRDECEKVLRELLADGPMPMKEAIKKTRDAVGCGTGSVHDAAKRLYVVKKPIRDGNKIDHWTWELPPTKIRLREIDGDGGDLDLEDPNP